MSDPEKEKIKKLKKKLKHQEKKNVEIRDQMAIQRTIFANERTLMAYLRTAITIIAGGFAAIKLSQHLYLEIIGIISMPLGLGLAAYSFYRYLQKQKLIERQRNDYTHTSHQHAELNEKEPTKYGNVD
ncbi:YidH family protein [Pontibacter toksunensis]|uniref:YidH family protein n=1 Tax=Pontibacter toksunensis TaxID=1332631 RepID=A0ABW6BRX5_9BACT